MHSGRSSKAVNTEPDWIVCANRATERGVKFRDIRTIKRHKTDHYIESYQFDLGAQADYRRRVIPWSRVVRGRDAIDQFVRGRLPSANDDKHGEQAKAHRLCVFPVSGRYRFNVQLERCGEST